MVGKLHKTSPVRRSQKVMAPSAVPTKIYIRLLDQAIDRTLSLPCREATLLPYFYLPGLSMLKAQISPSSNPPVNR